MPKVIIEKEGWMCLRCNHKWIPKNIDEKPICCPNCSNARWDIPKKEKKK